ncbi:MAG: amidase [Sandaracinaceae bacterium]
MAVPPFDLDVPTAARRIRDHGDRLDVYIATRVPRALEEASQGREGPLAGVPFGLKDEFDTPDLGTTGGSWRHRDRVTPGKRSAPHRAFDGAGGVLMGKTNLSDLGLPPEASSWVGGSTRNPFDPTRTAGGSSGGSAAAVAYGMQAFGWGTDIGGSIRLPAAFCGVLGLKLSDETWPIQDLFPNIPERMKWLCGQGPLARTVDQLRAVLDAAAPELRAEGPRPFAPTSVELFAPDPRDWPTFANDVGAVLKEALALPIRTDGGLAPPDDVREVYAGIWASHLDDLLAVDPDLTFWGGLGAVLSGVVFRGRVFGDRRFHPLTADLLLLIALGRYTLYRDRDEATRKAHAVRDAVRDLWADGRVIVMPVTVEPPPKRMRTTRHLKLLDYTVYGNLADATGLSIPFGTFRGTSLPRSIQLLGPPGSEDALLDLGARIVAARDARPDLLQPDTLLP